MGKLFDGVVDLSHHNSNVDFTKVATQVSAVIHKATQGSGFKDPTYAERRKEAMAAGLLWGAYHFGNGSDGAEQAEFFLSNVTPGEDLLVLDFEANATGPSMSLTEAHAFVSTVFAATGHYPGLYAGHYLKEMHGGTVDEVLQNCWLWIAQYSSQPVIPVTWADFTLWQYTDGAAGPNPVPVAGVGRCDRDQFNASAAGVTADAQGLATFWLTQTQVGQPVTDLVAKPVVSA
jgi:lysozyme